MTNQAFMIVDGPLALNLVEIAAYIDKLHGTEDNAMSQVAEELANAEDSASQQELYFTLTEGSSVMVKAPLNTLEAAYNLLIHVLNSAPSFDRLVPVLLSNLTSDDLTDHNRQRVILAILGNLFNVINPKSKLRFDVFNRIVSLANKCGVLVQLLPQLGNLPSWLQEWGLDQQTKTDIYLKLYEYVSKAAPKQLVSLLLDGARAGTDQEIAELLVKTALSTDDFFDFHSILAIDSVKELAKSNKPLFDTLEAVSNGDASKLESFADQPKVQKKLQITALTKLASEKNSLTYDEIAKHLGVEPAEVEVVVISTIKVKLLEARLDQVSQKVSFERVAIIGELSKRHWQEISERLSSLRSSLEATIGSVNESETSSDRIEFLGKQLEERVQ